MNEIDQAYHVLKVNERTVSKIYEFNNQSW